MSKTRNVATHSSSAGAWAELGNKSYETSWAGSATLGIQVDLVSVSKPQLLPETDMEIILALLGISCCKVGDTVFELDYSVILKESDKTTCKQTKPFSWASSRN